MPRLLGIDFETTGFDTGKDRITEIGAIVWDTDTGSPILIRQILLLDEPMRDKFTPETVEMMKRVSNITPEMLEEFGESPMSALMELEQMCRLSRVEYIVAHNGENFDKPMLMSELQRHQVEAPTLRKLPWIDTRTDLPFEEEPDSRKLKHLALDCGFINPFPHRAVFDVAAMLKVLAHHDINKVLEYTKIPFVTVYAAVDYKDRQLAKDRRFSWEKIGEQTYPKKWVKRIKENKLEEERRNAPFPVVLMS